MTRAFITAALISAAATTGAWAQSDFSNNMGQGIDMLQEALAGEFKRMGISIETLDNLSLGQIATIKQIIDSGDEEGQIKNRVQAVIRNN